MSGRRWLGWTGPGATFVLGLLCAVLLVGLVLAESWQRREPVGRPTAADPVTSVAGLDEARGVAGPLAERLLTYDWRTIGGKVEETRPLLSASFAREYAATVEGLREQVVTDRVSVAAEVRGSGVVAAGPERAVALVFLDQVSTTAGSPGQRVDQVRVLVTVTRDGGEWRVSRVDAF